MRHPATYVFVDAQHLKTNFHDTMSRWSGSPVDLDVAAIAPLLSATKVFYYDSIDDFPRPGEAADLLDARIREQELALQAINSIRNTHVRYGSITGRDRRKRRQKEVDILIAVDMMNHAIRENMEKAILVTGDRDFTPLVDTLVQFGLTVHVAGDHRSTSDVLRQAADYYQRLALSDYLQLVEQSVRERMPRLPSFSEHRDLRFAADPLASGPIGNKSGRVLFVKSRNCLAIELSSRRSAEQYALVTNRAELQRVQLYLELQHGEASWLDAVVNHLKE